MPSNQCSAKKYQHNSYHELKLMLYHHGKWLLYFFLTIWEFHTYTSLIAKNKSEKKKHIILSGWRFMKLFSHKTLR